MSQHTDKGATQCTRTTKNDIFFGAIYIISVYLETELYWHGIANADQMNKPDQWIRRKI